MKVEDILTLTKAGFSKDEIMTLIASETKPEEVKPEVKQPEEVKPEVKQPEEVKPEDAKQGADFSAYVKEVVDSTFKPFQDLYNNMAKLAGMPSIDNIKPLGSEDVIKKFLKDV